MDLFVYLEGGGGVLALISPVGVVARCARQRTSIPTAFCSIAVRVYRIFLVEGRWPKHTGRNV